MKIYVKQLSPIDKVNEHDYIDTNELDSCFFNKENIRTVNDTSIVVRFDFKTVVDSNNNENLYIVAINENNNKEYSIKIEDINKFVEDCATAVYNQKLPDSAQISIDLKNELISLVAKDILNDDHEILYNTEIKGFGEILSGNELVGTFESFSIDPDKRLKMNMFQSIVNLSDIENIRLKFFAFKKFVLNIIINSDIDPISNENGLITIDKIESADNEEIPKNIIELKDLSAFDSVEELLLNRRKLIKIEEENVYDDDDIDDFFD